MKQFTIRQDGAHFLSLSRLEDACNHAENLLAAMPAGQLSSLTVEDDTGYVLASITNRRIVGIFRKQVWVGDDAQQVEDVTFDATDYILQMSQDDVRSLRDGSRKSDDLAESLVQWDGPFAVILEDAVKEFFGVSSLMGITTPAIEFAKKRLSAEPATVQTVELTIKVSIRVMPGADVSEFVDNLDYSVFSNTSGINVIDTELVESN